MSNPSESQYEAEIFAAEIGQPEEIDLHELPSVHEALRDLDQFLDRCFVHGELVVRIIHGRGTGRLRAAVHTFLTTHPCVVFFKDSSQLPELQAVTYAVLRS